MPLDKHNLTGAQLYFINMILAAIHRNKDMLRFIKQPASGTSYALKVIDTLLRRSNPTELITN